ncbi:MAG: ABC transporter ATP-binding protein/permease, partial [Campylobacterales bacterium]|nr:ABC transporter ATP-binding protein/permease [Campylobacterales bacterium]
DLIWLYIGGMGLSLIVQFILSSKAYVHSSKVTFMISKKLRFILGDKLFKVGLGKLQKHDSGYFSSLILQDIRTFENFFSHSVPAILSGFFGVTTLLIFICFIDLRLGFLLILSVLSVLPFLYGANLIVEHFGKKHIESRQKMSSKFLEFYQGMKYIKSFNIIKKKFTMLDSVLKDFKKDSFLLEMIPGPTILLSFIMCELGFLFVIYKALDYYDNTTLTATYFIGFIILSYRVFEPVKLFLVDFLELRYMNNSLERIIEVLQYEEIDKYNPSLKIQNSSIHFKNVSFSYNKKEVLKDLTLSFKENQITALVGYSGEGKTTILNLIGRFWDVDGGEILIGGKEIRKHSLHELYKNISEVFQEVYLFNDSIYNNIKIAKPNAIDEEIFKVCKQARCDEFINRLENGIHTNIAEGGSKLSGGEKQRISIARALLKDSPIVLLDEATASLDPENESAIQQAIYQLTKNKTVIVIAHKLSTIQNADNIYVISNKKVLESGKHSDLMKINGKYKEMWDYQNSSKGWSIKNNF